MVRPTSLGRPLAIRQGQFGFEELPVGDVETEPPANLLDDEETDSTVETPYATVDPIPVLLEEASVAASLNSTVHWTATPTAGRLLLFVVYQRDGGPGAVSVSTTGWVVLGENDGAGSFDDTVAVFGKIADGTESSIHVNAQGGSSGAVWQLIEIPNAALPVADDNTNSGSATTAMTAGSVALAATGVIIGAFTHESSAHTFTQSGSWTILDDTIAVGTHPKGVFVYQLLSATSGNPAVTASGNADFRGVALAFDSADGVAWEFAPEVQDGDDATYHVVADDDSGYIVRCALDLDYRVGRSELLIGFSSSGSKTLDLYGATLADFSDETLLDTQTITATGSYTGDAVTFLPDGTLGLTYYRVAADPDVRIYTWAMYPVVDALASEVEAELAAHLSDTADAHDASAVSYDPTTSGLTATNAQAAIDELASAGGGGGAVAIKEGGSTVVATATALNAGHGLDVTDETGGVAGLAVDESELEIATIRKTLTNKSGGSVAAGDVVVISASTADAFTTTTVAQATLPMGVAMEAIANNATGLVALAGYVPLVNVPAGVTLRHYAETNGVAKQATGSSTRRAGSFGVFLTGSSTPDAILFGAVDDRQDLTSYIAKSLVTTKGDLIVATASATPARVGVGTNGYQLVARSGATPGLAWEAEELTLGLGVDGGGSVVTTGGPKFEIVVPCNCTVTLWDVSSIDGTSTTSTFDIKRRAYGGGAAASLIGAGTKPFVTAGTENQAAPASWTSVALLRGDRLQLFVDANNNGKLLGVTLTATRT